MARISTALVFTCAAFALATPLVHAAETFDLEMASTGFSPSGSGTITLLTDPGNGTFAFANYNPVIDFSYNSYNFTQADIVAPASPQFILSDFNGQRRFQFDGGGGSSVFFDKNIGNGNIFEVSFRPDTYGTSNEIGSVAYSALATVSTDVPEPGSIAGLAAAVLTGASCLRKRRAVKARSHAA